MTERVVCQAKKQRRPLSLHKQVSLKAAAYSTEFLCLVFSLGKLARWNLACVCSEARRIFWELSGECATRVNGNQLILRNEYSKTSIEHNFANTEPIFLCSISLQSSWSVLYRVHWGSVKYEPHKTRCILRSETTMVDVSPQLAKYAYTERRDASSRLVYCITITAFGVQKFWVLNYFT